MKNIRETLENETKYAGQCVEINRVNTEYTFMTCIKMNFFIGSFWDE